MSDVLKQILENDNISDEDFLKSAYRVIFHREVDMSGREYYLAKLAQGKSRKSIIQNLVYSAEARRMGVIIPDFLMKKEKPKNSIFLNLKRLDNYLCKNIPDNFQSKYDMVKNFGYQNYIKMTNKKPASKESTSINPSSGQSMQPVNDNLNIVFVDNVGQSTNEKKNQIWFDLTTSFEWQQGIVGIVRAELQVAKELKNQHPDLRFFMHYGCGFVEIDSEQLNWLLTADNVADAYLKFFKRKNFSDSNNEKGHIKLEVPNSNEFYHPFKSFDVIFSMGWMDSQKEKYFTILKEQCNDIYLSYLVYDTILVNDTTKQYYHKEHNDAFFNYIKWINNYCDFVLTGGETAKLDLIRIWQEESGWSLPIQSVKFGSNSLQNISLNECESVLDSLGINRDFFMVVGSIEPRKNYDTLYRAYLRALEKVSKSDDLPILVICGSNTGGVEDLVDSIARNPLLTGNVIQLSPNEMELAVLYKKCLFTVLPSVYEGWSLTLPESLGQGKFCLCADTPPLREIGNNLVDFVEKFNVEQWADKIVFYSQNKKILQKKESVIKKQWIDITWKDTSLQILNALLSVPKNCTLDFREKELEKRPNLWMDLTLCFLHWGGGITGIVRAQLSYARYLHQLDSNIRFFALQYHEQGSYFFEIKHDYLMWLFNETELSEAYKNFHIFWNDAEQRLSSFRNPCLSVEDFKSHPSYIKSFPENSLLLLTAVDYMLYGGGNSPLQQLSNQREALLKNSSVCQIVYDFTPTLYSHLHTNESCVNYEEFIKCVYENTDFIIYGGKTAQIDGNVVRESRGWKNPPSDFIEFGSDIKAHMSHSEDAVISVLSKYGLRKKEYILTVGTIEPRKNHEMLYRAYEIKFSEGKLDKMPTLFIAGKAGWKTSNFLDIINRDARFNGKIIIDSPTDQELDILYQNCAFTVLPTFYEGWSLTLPESLSYGKMCITSDAPPLKEVGRDMLPYINPLDTQKWSDEILNFFQNPNKIMDFENKIRSQWHAKTWLDSARDLKSKIEAFHQGKQEND